MSNAKRARPAGGAAGQAAGLCDRAGQQSHEQYSTERTGKASCIYDLLPVGAENAISRRQLMQITGLKDRQLRHKIEKERKAGLLILSSTAEVGGGYFRAASVAELRRWVAMMQAYGSSVNAVLRVAYEALADVEQGGNISE